MANSILPGEAGASRSGASKRIAATIPIANGAAPPKFDNEERILETIRQHLRELRRNEAIGRVTFDLDVNRGGVSRYWVEVNVKYRFLESTPAVSPAV